MKILWLFLIFYILNILLFLFLFLLFLFLFFLLLFLFLFSSVMPQELLTSIKKQQENDYLTNLTFL